MKVHKFVVNLAWCVAGAATAVAVISVSNKSNGKPAQTVSWKSHRNDVRGQGEDKEIMGAAGSSVALSRLQSELVQLDGVDQMRSDENSAGFVVVPSRLLEEFSSKLSKLELKDELFTSDSRVEDILKITDQEKAQLQRSWREMQRKLKRAEVKCVKIDEVDDGSVCIQVPDMSKEVLAMGEHYKASVASVLGENRGLAFSAIKQLDSAFSVAEEDTTYFVKMESIGDGFWRYHMKQQGASGNRAWLGQQIPTHLRHLTEEADIVSELESPAEVDGEL